MYIVIGMINGILHANDDGPFRGLLTFSIILGCLVVIDAGLGLP